MDGLLWMAGAMCFGLACFAAGVSAGEHGERRRILKDRYMFVRGTLYLIEIRREDADD